MTVRIVTDSAADLPADLAEANGITVVPLTVRFGDDAYLSGVELGTKEFWEKLRTSSESPATAAPSAGDFQTVYQQLMDDGATGIVSVHLSSKLSATCQSAQVAAREISDVPIEVVDTLAVTAGTGLLALHAAERASDGASAADIASEITQMVPRVRMFGVIDTLEYLRRGGRIGGAQALLGSMLKVKPIISLADGVVEPTARVRTRAKALEHLVGIVEEHRDKIKRLVMVSGEAPDSDAVADKLRSISEVEASDIWELGPVVGTHAGPGLVGVSFILQG